MYRATGVALLTLLCAFPSSARPAAAQPPIQGVTGTIATDGTIESEHRAAGAVAEGAKKVVDKVKNALPGGGKGTNQNPLDAFTEGRRVVVRDAAAAGDEAPKATDEGVVIDVNRKRQQITVRFADRKTQTLRLKAPGAATDVVVSYTDETGVKVSRDFTVVS
jgi:hypothetical protein